MMRRLPAVIAATSTLLAALFYLSGCAVDEDAGCFADDECRFGRICVEGRCVGDPDPTITGGGTNNGGQNNGGQNNGGQNNGGQNNGDQNNGIANNGNQNNGIANNGIANNGIANNGQNNGNQNNGVVNNGIACDSGGGCPSGERCTDEGICRRVCVSTDNCDEGDICVFGDGDQDAGVCGEPWECSSYMSGGGPDVCRWVTQCDEIGPAGLTCEVDGSEAECECITGDGQINEFETRRYICDAGTVETIDRVNEACGWRLPPSDAGP